MADEKFQAALKFLWRPENDGQQYHVTRGDTGGATAWGVTFATYTAWRVLHGIEGPGGTLAEFATFEPEDFQPFYRGAFWNPVAGDQLAAGLGLVVFDAGVMSGVARASRWLQRVVGTAQDGAIGPRTIQAAGFDRDPVDLIHRFTNVRRDFYDGIVAGRRDQFQFLSGWMRRAKDCEIAGLNLAAAVR